MRKLLSQKVALAAKIKSSPYQLHDIAIPGLILRVQPSGTKIWKLVQNHKPRTLGRLPVTTFAMARSKAALILRGEDPDVVSDTDKLTFDDFLSTHYQPYVEANHSRPKETLAILRRFKLGEKLLDEIKLADVETWRIKRQALNRSPKTVNRDTVTLKAALHKAVDWELLDIHPLARLKPLKVDRRRKVRYLSFREEQRLVAALVARDALRRDQRRSGNKHRQERGYELMLELGVYTDNLTPLVLLALNTGLRRGELWKLTWGDVDMSTAWLTVNGSGAKSGQTRQVPLNADAIDVLKTHRGKVLPLPNEPIFGRAEFRKAFAGVLNSAKIENFRFHDIRHSFASKLVTANVPLNTVRELLGHASIEMTLIYAHLAPDNLRAAVDAI